MAVELDIRQGIPFGITVLVLLTCGCGNVKLPAVTTQRIDNAVDAKELARQIAGQRCKYYGYKDLGIADYGAQQFYCHRGMYTLELGQTHLFDHRFHLFKADDEVRFRYSDKVLMKPQYVGEAKPQDANPAYYLEPIR